MAGERPQDRAAPGPPPEGVKEAWGGPALPRERPQDRAAPGPPPEGVKEAWGGPALPREGAAAPRRPGIGARLARLWRHSGVDDDRLARRFDAAVFERIEAAIADGEGRHRGEIRFALEGRLTAAAIWRGQTPRERAVEVFARHGVWDTEGNTGVLVYLLWADHAVEIIADRAAGTALAAGDWAAICDELARACRDGRAVDGVLTAIGTIHRALAVCLPVGRDADTDELANRPIRL